MDFKKFTAKRIVIMVGVFVAIVLIAFVAVTLILDLLYIEQIRSAINAEINESPELCEDFSSVEECVDFWNELASVP